ncbi:hypothetical protein Sango_2682400 [Sesamum angolense]|uniref:Uncharacterized protein n=1 Tax=Sesamum angolense TaxID=2727404 RepID=A0AAE1W2P8_9LAMI|nr:hypothetical protein Sango_2682400 [Sesamum angolense]
MIKAVFQAIPIYSISCFKIPDIMLSKIGSMLDAFFWDQDGDRKIHWPSWKKVCPGKWDGDLGIRNLKEFNTTFLCKKAWQSLANPNYLLHCLFKQ